MRGDRLLLTFIFLIAFFHTCLGDDDPATILQRADASFANRNYLECLPDFLAVLKAYERQNNQRGIADVCYKIGRANRKLARFEEADRYLTRALKLHQELGDREAEGLDLTEWAVSRERVGAYDEALQLSEKALAVNQETGNKDALARTLENFANTYYRQAQFPKAIEYFNRAIPPAIEGGDKETLMNIWQNLGQVYFGQNDYDEALSCYAKSKTLANEIGDPRLLGPISGNEAIVYWNLGDLEKARTTFEQNLPVFQQSGAKQHLANTYQNLGGVNIDLGDYGKAQEALLKSYELAEELKDQGLAAVALNALGSLHLELANYELARDYFRRSIKISEETGERREAGASLLYLGQVYETQHRYEDALGLYRKALQLFNETGDKMRIAVTFEKIGDLYALMGDHDRELENHKAALSLRESSGEQVGIASSNLKVGTAYYSKGSITEADAALTSAIAVLRDAGSQALLWRALYRKGLVCRDTGRTGESIGWMKQAIEVIENIRGSVELPEQKWSYLEDKVNIYEDLVQLLIKTQDTAGAFDFAERSKARAFLDLLSEARINPDHSLNSPHYKEKRKLIARLVDLNTRIQDEYQKSPLDQAAIQGLKGQQNRLNADFLKLQVRIREENPRYEQLQRPEPLNVAQARSLIDSKSAIAEYFVGKKTSILFMITSGDIRAFDLPGEDKLRQQVRDLLDAIQKPEVSLDATTGSFSRYRELALLVYKEILNPAEKVLRGKDRLILVPDGPLNYLPFEALLTRSEGNIEFSALPYLALQYRIQYVPSVSALSALREKNRSTPAKARDLLAFADPVLSGSKKDEGGSTNAVLREWAASLPDLPYARAEVEAISGLYPAGKVTVFMDKDASESNVKKTNLEEYRMVHFASHGLIDEEQPQFSALVLTPGDDREDGFLTMREVFDLKLNADLVVLSACKSGLGKQVRGEGLAGLSRAFFSAGTSSVLVSLWNVYDQSTAEFMTSFYKKLQQRGLSKAAALHEARIHMIRGGKFSHPYYWAPFILIGAD